MATLVVMCNSTVSFNLQHAPPSQHLTYLDRSLNHATSVHLIRPSIATGQRTLQLTTSLGRVVLVFLPKDGNRDDPGPTNSFVFLALAGSTLNTLLLTSPPPTEPRPLQIGEVTNLTCTHNEHKEIVGCRAKVTSWLVNFSDSSTFTHLQ